MNDLIERLLNPRSFDHEALRKEAAARIRELEEELARLRAENERLEKLNKANSDGWAEAVKLNMMALTPAEADRLRAEKDELLQVLREMYFDDTPEAAEKAWAIITRANETKPT
jgi:hypothetical protein